MWLRLQTSTADKNIIYLNICLRAVSVSPKTLSISSWNTNFSFIISFRCPGFAFLSVTTSRVSTLCISASAFWVSVPKISAFSAFCVSCLNFFDPILCAGMAELRKVLTNLKSRTWIRAFLYSRTLHFQFFIMFAFSKLLCLSFPQL